MQVTLTAYQRRGLFRSMTYYLLTAFVIGGALGVLHWAIVGS
jgi:hypothetical protein